ncbi:tetratricopeptide repeat protein, partial [Singulisphaera rosea]
AEVGPAVDAGSLKGTWTARPAEGTTITLTFKADKSFEWKVTEKGQNRQFNGESTLGENILTLAQNSGPAMVGRVFMKGNDQFTFKVVGDGPDDPGLTFTR